MAKKEKFDVRITTEELRLRLQSELAQSKFSSLVASVIIDNLSETDVGLEQLYKAFSGVAPVAKFKVLDKVLVNKDSLPTWRLDAKETEKLLFKGKFKAVITQVNLQRKASYRVSYEYVENGKSAEELTTGEWDVEEQYLILIQDDFIDDPVE